MIPTTESVTTLARRWAAGDRRAGSELVAKHDGWIRAYARRKALPWEDVDDVAQIMRVAFLESAQRVDAVYGDTETRAYIRNAMLLSVMNERRYAYARKHNMASVGADHLFAGSEDTQNATVDAHQLMSRAPLTAEERRVVVARCIDELYQEEVATELGCHERVVRRNFDAAIAKLRTQAGHAGSAAACPRPASRWTPTSDTDERVVALIKRSGTALGQTIRESLDLTRHTYLDSVTRLRKSGRIIATGSHMARSYTLAAASPTSA